MFGKVNRMVNANSFAERHIEQQSLKSLFKSKREILVDVLKSCV